MDFHHVVRWKPDGKAIGKRGVDTRIEGGGEGAREISDASPFVGAKELTKNMSRWELDYLVAIAPNSVG